MFAVLRHREFRLLWAGQTTSVLGDAMVLVAVGLFVTRLTDDPADVGWVLGAYALPLVLFVLVGGVIADRLPRQRVMICSDAIRMVLHGTLAVLIGTGVVRVWHMVVIGACFGTAEAFFRPAYTGLTPQTVPEDEIQRAQALVGISREVATFASPALATALVLGPGAAWAFGLDAATFGVSALFLLQLRPRERGERSERTTMVRELAEGWGAVRSRPWVWATILAFSVALFTALGTFFTLGASVAEDVYGNDAIYGISNAAWGLGTVSGALAAGRWKPRFPMRVAMLGAMWWPLTISVYALGPPVAVVYVAMAAAGAGIGVFAVMWETAMAQRIPPHLLSRVSAWDWMGSLALLPLGYVLAGPAGKLWGEVEVLVVGGLVGFAACAMALMPHDTRHLARLEPGESVGDLTPDAAAADELGLVAP